MEKMIKKLAGLCWVGAVVVALATAAHAEDKSIAAPVASASAAATASAGATAHAADANGGYRAAAATPVNGDEVERLAASEPLAARVAGAEKQTRLALNMAWMLMCAFLVFFMQTGFALVETGFCRAKNASHTMAMNLMVFCIGVLAYWACGFALEGCGTAGLPAHGGVSLHLFGKVFGLFGTHGFFLSGTSNDSLLCTAFLFQVALVAVSTTIPTGAMAERFKFAAFVPYVLVMAGFLYPLYANWVWGGGWLAGLGANFGLGHGHLDFAGSSVVHMTGGVVALAGTLVLGPRIGKFNKDGSANPIPGHHIPMAIIGTLILAFGWFGFNTGSAFAAGDLRGGAVAVNTVLAGAAGGFLAMAAMWFKYGKPDLTMSANGLLAGLVAISAASAFVSPFSAVLIGAVAGVVCCLSVFFTERVLKIDDPVGAISVHGVCGIWGTLALGLFANGSYGEALNGVKGTVRGLFYGDGGQLAAQLIGTAANVVFVFGVAYLFFKALDRIMGIRVASDIEREGLDQYEVAAAAYPEFNLRQLPFSSGYSQRR